MRNTLYILMLFPSLIFSQEKISGMIMEANEKKQHIGLAGANVYWLNTEVGTVTDIDGNYSISAEGSDPVLIFSSSGWPE